MHLGSLIESASSCIESPAFDEEPFEDADELDGDSVGTDEPARRSLAFHSY
jgi:hypothetical protein